MNSIRAAKKTPGQLYLFSMEPTKAIPKITVGGQAYTKPLGKLPLILSSVDWEVFEEGVLKVVQEAVAYFNSVAEPCGEVSQFSVRTEPQSQTTFISINTDSRLSQGKPSRIPHSDNPAEFHYFDLCYKKHEALLPLDQLNYCFSSHMVAADKRIEKSLLVVQRQIISGQVLLSLPLAQESRFGISSAKSWYDHEVIIRQPQTAAE